ncbi:hypothetical protein Y032_0513g2760 [Ancylostoma ceylanicum]|uniref:CULT domain-containing protein n=1 Tax=Ancylostoma ceylanicum TaxID=53326 RepID=A0A016WV37_9BILA|nr:hypothetical protein Y032_0513g2760 [Ancylostoma ceylanicum]
MAQETAITCVSTCELSWILCYEGGFLFQSYRILGLECRRVGELLCRHCGASVTRQSELINAATSEHLYKYKYQFPIVGENATIYVFENPNAETFHVLTARTAHLKLHGQPSSEATWFDGMQWTPCVCSYCERHLGWYFQPDKHNIQQSQQKGFVGLVLDYLVSKDFADSITKAPI